MIRSCLLLALLALVFPLARATTVFNETFTGGSTINSNPPNPAATSPNAIAYQQLAAKTFNPNPPTLGASGLRFGIVGTTSGFNHIQALFTNHPVTLAETGDYLELTVTFTTEGGIITPQTNSTLFFGLHHANQEQPFPGGMNGTSATATAGYAQNWKGYVNRIFYAGGNNGFFARPAQTATAANNQDVLYNFSGASTIGSTSPSALAAFGSGSVFTEVFRIARAGANSLSLSSALYSGDSPAGAPLYSQSATSTSVLTAVFDAFAIGWRATGSVASAMNITAIKITTTGHTVIVPEILAQPFSLTKSVGENIELSVEADGGKGTTLTYQWRKDGVDLPGATAPTYMISAVSLADAGDYTVVVTSPAGSTTSDVATLTVTSGPVPPSIVTPPQGATLLVGEAHTFDAIVNGTSPLAFQWQKSETAGGSYTDIPAAVDASHAIDAATLGDAGIYRLVVTNSQGSATSTPAELVVNQPPAITAQPVGGTLNRGGSLTLSVAATGTPAPSYQWRRNGVNLPGATTASHTITDATGADAGVYSVVVTNSVGSITSDPAAVAVLSPSLAPTTFSPSSGASGLNPDRRLTLTFNAPVSPGSSGLLRIHDAATDAVVDTIDLVAANALRDSLRASSTLSTQPLPVQKKPIGGVPNDFNYYPLTVSGSSITIHPRNGVLAYGKTYYVTIEPGVFVDESGETFAGISDAATWRFSTRVAGPAAGATSLTVAADGSGDFDTLQAALDFIPAANTTPTTIRLKKGTYFELVVLQAKHAVTLVGEDVDQTILTYPNNNTFNNASGVYHRSVLLAQSVRDFAIANLTIHNTTPQNGSQAEAIVINGTSASAARNVVTRCKFYSYQDTVQFNKQTYVSDCVIWGDVDFLWGDGPAYLENCDIRILRTGGYFTQIRNGSGNHGYVFVNCRFTAPAGITGTFFGRIDPASFPFSEVVILDSVLGDAANNAFLSTATGVSGSSYRAGWWLLNNAASAAAAPNVHNWADNIVDADGAATASTSADAFTVMPSDPTTQANYRDAFWVLNTNLAGTVNGSWTPALAPIFAVPPVSQIAQAGDPVTFSANVVAIPSATYQWRKNGIDLAGATAASYTIPLARGTDTGSYTVVVTNAAGSVVSPEAVLTIEGELVAPVITTPPESQLIAEGASGTLSVTALGTAPLSYQWHKDGAPISGATAATHTIADASPADAGVYHVVVTNPAGSTSSETAVVTVKGIAAIAPTGYAASVTGGAGGPVVVVTTLEDLKAHAESTTPATIIVAGTIDLGVNGRIKLQSHKTLRGATTSSTILGTINISNATNVIVSNLNISADTGEPSVNDGVTIANSTNVLVTKCTIYNSTDGNLDVINGSDLVTVSWCKFYYTRNNGHNFSNLVGSSDTDIGSGDGLTNYRVTWHHNWWSGQAKQRMIACRFGSSHMFNNYWDCAGNDYCTESRNIASVFSEHNYYDGVKNPLAKRTATATDIGRLLTIGNIFDACTGSQAVDNDAIFTPPYSYALLETARVPAIVKAGAGNVTTDAPVATSATIVGSAPVSAAGGAFTLTAVVDGITPQSYQWRRDNFALPGANAATLEFSNLQPSDAGLYTVVIGVAEGDAIVSAPHALAVQFAPVITAQPISRSVTVGDDVTFSVTASGDAPLAYQWFKDDNALSGAAAATLELTSITTASAGRYRCVVSNAAGTASSDAAVLTVNQAAATVTVASDTTVYDGTGKTLTVITSPAGLPVIITYNGATTPPADAGTYLVVATIDHPDYTGTGSGSLTIERAPASVTLGSLSHIFDGTPKSASAVTDPAGLPVTFTYNDDTAAPSAAGSYTVFATVVHPNYTGSATGTLVIGKATATIALSSLVHAYDGLPKPASFTTQPAGLDATITYDGAAAAPVFPGSHTVVATIEDPNYSGSASDSLLITVTALTRQLSTLDGEIDGSVQVLTAGNITLNSSAMISGDLLVPGTPRLQLNGHPEFAGPIEGDGATAPDTAVVTINGKAILRYLVRRVDPIALTPVAAPQPPIGTRRVTINRSGDPIGDFATVLDLTLNGHAVAIPAGRYGRFTANANSRFIVGVAGATEPAHYDFQQLTLNGNATLQIAGPVVITLADGFVLDTNAGSSVQPGWLVLRVASGTVTLNGRAALHGTVLAPNSTVTLNDHATLRGRVECDRLIVNGRGILQESTP